MGQSYLGNDTVDTDGVIHAQLAKIPVVDESFYVKFTKTHGTNLCSVWVLEPALRAGKDIYVPAPWSLRDTLIPRLARKPVYSLHSAWRVT